MRTASAAGSPHNAAIAARVDVLLVSVLMLHSALLVADLRHLLDERGAAAMPVIVGGAPFVQDPGLWRSVHATRGGRSAADVLPAVEDLLGGAP